MPTIPKWINDALEKVVPSMIRIVKVTDIVYLTPNTKRIRLQGDFSDLEFNPGFDLSFRVNATDLRHYTVSYGNALDGIIEFIAYLHTNTVGSNFINSLTVGDENIKLTTLGCHKLYTPLIDKQVIFGDETSLSLMSSFLPFLKKNGHQYQFLIELDDSNRDIPEILGLENFTVFSKNTIFRDVSKIKTLQLFKNEEWSDANVILTGNITSLQNFRKVLKEYGHQGKIYAKGYWLEGKKGL